MGCFGWLMEWGGAEAPCQVVWQGGILNGFPNATVGGLNDGRKTGICNRCIAIRRPELRAGCFRIGPIHHTFAARLRSPLDPATAYLDMRRAESIEDSPGMISQGRLAVDLSSIQTVDDYICGLG